jgi:hypothetical protein
VAGNWNETDFHTTFEHGCKFGDGIIDNAVDKCGLIPIFTGLAAG